MRENRISVFRKHTLGILVALGMVLFGSVFILFTNIGKNKATVAAEETLQFIKEQSSRSEAFAEFYQGLHLEMNGIIMICKNVVDDNVANLGYSFIGQFDKTDIF